MSLEIEYDPEDRPAYQLPKEGMQIGVLADVHDLGFKDITWAGETKSVRKVLFIWQVEERDEKYNNRLTASQSYKWSLHEKSKLRAMLAAWKGIPADGPFKVDLETYIGESGLIQVKHSVGKSRTYANVVVVAPLMAGMTPLQIEDYTRVKDRKKDEATPVAVGAPTDEDMPF